MRKSIVVILITSCLSGGFSLYGQADTTMVKSKSELPEVNSFTSPPVVPSAMEFCGKKIDLTRYDMYERFDRELSAMCYMHSSSIALIKRANRYFPVIDPILKQMGIPEDMKYLAVIESSLNVRAVSSVKAGGLWQFMPATGDMYGLEVNDSIDERYHVEKSTVAACKMLKDLYAQFRDWASVAAAYNIGSTRIRAELGRQLGQSALDLYLVEETSRYVFRILAAKAFFANPYKYGFAIKANQLYKPIQCREVLVNSTVDNLYKFAIENNTTFLQIKDFNPWLRGRSIPDPEGKIYKIKIPLTEDLYYKGEKIIPYSSNWVVGN